ncbi:MAG: NUDIX domain-containing protein [Anaerolineales bacterium]
MPGSDCLLAALVLVEQNGKILLVRESAAPFRGKWSLPGGRLQPGESIRRTAERELLEETGILPELTGLLYIDQLVGTEAGGRIRFVFLGKPAGGELKKTEDEHSMCADWFAYEDIRRLDQRSPFLQRVVDVFHGGPAAMPIGGVHILTPEEISMERP